ncbi:type II secretion system protein [Andreprevotia chitinilytica]|uniref:type II secretion system protein n=1 Tax=Andreprevotia chitinilytica TaxID=396808 RepID=UPI0006895CF8|nr:type II secretion system protein [Andreprevotia chitinilytica]
MGRCGQSGFTYIALLFVIALICLGLTLAVEMDRTVGQRDKERELLFVGEQFQQAIQRYYESVAQAGRREYPESLDALLKDPRLAASHRYLRKVYVDPMTNKPEWGLVTLNGRIVGVYSKSPVVPIKQDNFDVPEAAFQGASAYRDWLFTYPYDLIQKGGFTKVVADDSIVLTGGTGVPATGNASAPAAVIPAASK